MLLIFSYHYYASSELKVDKSVDSNKRVGRPIICNKLLLCRCSFVSLPTISIILKCILQFWEYNITVAIINIYLQINFSNLRFLRLIISKTVILHSITLTVCLYLVHMLFIFYSSLRALLIPGSRCYFLWSTSITHRFANASIKKTVGLKRLYNIELMLPSP